MAGSAGRDAARLDAALWNYELFSASESTQVEGRAVTVDYGVTVGKSIGVLGLFALGFAVARLARGQRSHSRCGGCSCRRNWPRC